MRGDSSFEQRKTVRKDHEMIDIIRTKLPPLEPKWEKNSIYERQFTVDIYYGKPNEQLVTAGGLCLLLLETYVTSCENKYLLI